jgi:hypothetical protein
MRRTSIFFAGSLAAAVSASVVSRRVCSHDLPRLTTSAESTLADFQKAINVPCGDVFDSNETWKVTVMGRLAATSSPSNHFLGKQIK